MALFTRDDRRIRVPSRRARSSSRTRAPRAHRRGALVARALGTCGTAWAGPHESGSDGRRPPPSSCGGMVRLAATCVDASRLRLLASPACTSTGCSGGWLHVGRWTTDPGLHVQPTARGASRTWTGPFHTGSSTRRGLLHSIAAAPPSGGDGRVMSSAASHKGEAAVSRNRRSVSWDGSR